MKVNYHFHSGVSVEADGSLFIFDYYKKGPDDSVFGNFEFVYVFASHGHRDHFDKKILEWKEHHDNVRYVFSYDIPVQAGMAAVVRPGESIRAGSVEVSALKSTDEGVAFVVNTGEGKIFHSGDLNWWHWEGEPEDDNLRMAKDYKNEIDKLGRTHLDVAFIPIDNRLGESKYLSIDYLMENVPVGMVCPIHFWDDFAFLRQVEKDLSDREYFNRINFYKER